MHVSVEAASSTAHLLAGVARILAQVAHHGRSLDDALTGASVDEAVSRSALQALAFGSLRWYPRIEYWLNSLLERPADLRQPELRGLLTVGLYQLAFSSHPPHAIVHQAVEAARLLNQERSTRLVNAILRRFLRERTTLEEKAQRQPTARFAHPQWLIDRLRSNWPQDWERVLDANNEPPPFWLRVNTRLGTTADYLALLEEKGLEASLCEAAPEAILLTTPMDVGDLPQFDAGRVSIQDAGAQLAALFLDAQPGMRVLDACAAPGGKTCHILERASGIAGSEIQPGIQLIAVDRSSERLKQIEDNLRRLGLKAELIAGDASRPEEWWPATRENRGFQRILLDVPCSATGVIRRHPDIKLLRRPADIEKLAREQSRLLRGLWPLLEPGGRLLYASCSVLRAENVRVVADFLKDEPSAAEWKIHAPLPAVQRQGSSSDAGPGLQILPGEAGMDGFYYACLEKRH